MQSDLLLRTNLGDQWQYHPILQRRKLRQFAWSRTAGKWQLATWNSLGCLAQLEGFDLSQSFGDGNPPGRHWLIFLHGAQQRGKQDRKEEGWIHHSLSVLLLLTYCSSGSSWVGFRQAGCLPEDSFWTVPASALGNGQRTLGFCSGENGVVLPLLHSWLIEFNLCMSVFSSGKCWPPPMGTLLNIWAFMRTMVVLQIYTEYACTKFFLHPH